MMLSLVISLFVPVFFLEFYEYVPLFNKTHDLRENLVHDLVLCNLCSDVSLRSATMSRQTNLVLAAENFIFI